MALPKLDELAEWAKDKEDLVIAKFNWDENETSLKVT